MKHLFLILFVALTAIVVIPAQSKTVRVTDKPCIEKVVINDVVSTDINTVADRIQSCPDVKPETIQVLYSGCNSNRKYPLHSLKKRQINYAGFGSFLYADGDQDSYTVEQTEDPSNNSWSSFIQWILLNKAILLSFALALSEVLALIPGINQNGIFQSVFAFLKSKKKKPSEG